MSLDYSKEDEVIIEPLYAVFCMHVIWKIV